MRKIFSFFSSYNMDSGSFPFPNLKDPENLSDETAIKYIGYLPDTNEQFFSYDEDNTVFPQQSYHEIFKFKIYDNSIKDDFEKLKLVLKNSGDIRRTVLEIGDKEISNRPLYNWLIAMVDNNEEVINLLRNINIKQDDYLKSLGFVGLEQFY